MLRTITNSYRIKLSGAPLVEIHLGHGTILASELTLWAKDKDPVPARLLANMIAYLTIDITRKDL